MIKSVCRKVFLDKRKQLSDTDIEEKSNLILELLVDQFDLSNKIISIFLPISSKKEINTSPLLELKEVLNIQFVLPVADFSSNTMKHIVFEDEDQLKKNKFDIPEPTYGEEINEQSIDVVLVPLLCFDRKGYRVGYGKGFYDRFLKQCKKDCIFIGLSYFDAIETIEDRDETDISLHFCITTKKIYTF
ncbi:MAG: 5-formyltetrahydrofolate cyclo-ligase [Crocinitomicaceae bacterium]|nr:5-formyltetrahydrofolate cyclo-ligase [Crocinitomicaceae bacterium]